MRLHYNPYRIFNTSKTPAGLYARQKWLGQAGNRQWKTDFEETIARLFADQSDDGSWHQSDVETITKLFGLHLTVRESSTRIDAALNWLLERIDIQSIEIDSGSEVDVIQEKLTGLPFIPSRRDMFLIGATLFLASIFERDDDPSVLAIYRWLSLEGTKNKGLWFDRACSHNILRAKVVHPVFAADPATILVIESLADIQSESGDWEEGLPFYQTLNALAHLDIPAADKQLEKAFIRLSKTQKADGSWSKTESEWNTFLAVHALRNKGLL
ncbi:MAG: hypothetical protein PVF56_12890 [Desulfobacterales bacterium]